MLCLPWFNRWFSWPLEKSYTDHNPVFLFLFLFYLTQCSSHIPDPWPCSTEGQKNGKPGCVCPKGGGGHVWVCQQQGILPCYLKLGCVCWTISLPILYNRALAPPENSDQSYPFLQGFLFVSAHNISWLTLFSKYIKKSKFTNFLYNINWKCGAMCLSNLLKCNCSNSK